MPLRAAFAALAALLAFSAPALAREQLVIGVSQFPPTLNPAIDAVLAKSYVLGLARRPITAFDAHWQLVCMLCVTSPHMNIDWIAPADGRRRLHCAPTVSTRTIASLP